MMPEWVPAFEADEKRMPSGVRERLLQASGWALDRLLMRYVRAAAGP